MTDTAKTRPDGGNEMQINDERYWREAGGANWADNIERTEAILAHLNPILLEAAAVKAGERILDVGCGGGVTSRLLAEAAGDAGRVTGLDISAPILERARTRFGDTGNPEWILADAATHDFGGGQFDLLCSRFGVMFFSDPIRAFGNLGRALTATGRLAYLCWQTPDKNPWMTRPVAALAEVVPPEGTPPEPTAPGPFSMGEEAVIREILEQSGFVAPEIISRELMMNMGTMREALTFYSRNGPAAQTIREADDHTRARILAAIEKEMRPFLVNGILRAPAMIWIVKAARRRA